MIASTEQKGWSIHVVNKYQEPRTTVELFLTEMNGILNDPTFNPDRNFDLLRYDKNKSAVDPNTVNNTLIELDYDSSDVIATLRSLTAKDYLHNMIDNKPGETESFFVFIKQIKSRDVYMKVKIRKKIRQVFCNSFHFPDFPVTVSEYPYR